MGLSVAFLRLAVCFYFGLARFRPRLSIVTAVVIMALTTIMSSRMALIKDGVFMEMLRPAGRRVTLNFLETWSCWHQMPDVYIKSVSKSQLVRTSSSLQDAPPCRFPSSVSPVLSSLPPSCCFADTDVPVSPAKTHDICLDVFILLAYKTNTPSLE